MTKRIVSWMLVLAVFALAARFALALEIRDFDELWHLATGRLIVESRSVPLRDPFTFTAGDTPWVNTNWLAQVFIYEVWRVSGFEGLALYGMAFLLAALAFVHRAALERSKNGLAALLVLAWVGPALATGSTIRPQGWTFLLLALSVLIVERLRVKPTAALTGLQGALLALSIQLHGGYIFVFALVVLALVDGPRRHLLAALALGAVGFLVHPHGFESLLHPIRYALDPAVKEIHKGASELQPPDLGVWPGVLLSVPLLVLLAAAFVGKPKLRVGEVVTLLAFLHLALTSRRGLHYFAIVAAGPAAAVLDAALAKVRVPRLDVRGVALALAAAWAVSFLHAEPALHRGVPRSLDSPVFSSQQDVAQVASWLRTTNPPGEVWNEIATGGALIWALWPERRVYIDGRGDLHARVGSWQEMGRVVEGRNGWEEILAKRRCETVVIDEAAPLAQRLHERGWKRVFWASGVGRTLGVWQRRESSRR